MTFLNYIVNFLVDIYFKNFYIIKSHEMHVCLHLCLWDFFWMDSQECRELFGWDGLPEYRTAVTRPEGIDAVRT